MNTKVTTDVKQLTVIEGVAIVAGIVIGAGIFKTPALVASNSTGTSSLLFAWIIGGFISLIGAFCYAELATTFPGQGGEYHFLFKAFGSRLAFLFGWARLTVIQTGSIAMLGFLVGDYASEIFNLGAISPSLYAALAILLFTLTNALGLRSSSLVQKIFFITVLSGLILVVLTGLFFSTYSPTEIHKGMQTQSTFGRAMIFVLLTYGGWNEAAYLSAEIKQSKKNIVKVLFYSIGLITTLYFIINIAFLKGLGFSNLAGSEAAAADLMKNFGGEYGVVFISFLIVVASLSTLNAVIFTGARSAYAMGKDFSLFRIIHQWEERKGQPVRALILQALIALLLIAGGTGTRSGFELMVEYTAPVFWLFFFLTGMSLFMLRYKEPHIHRPFKVPLYPIVPLSFCIVSVLMFYASVMHTGKGAFAGIVILATGIPFMLFSNRIKS